MMFEGWKQPVNSFRSQQIGKIIFELWTKADQELREIIEENNTETLPQLSEQVIPRVEVDAYSGTLVVGLKIIPLTGRIADFIYELIVAQHHKVILPRQEGKTKWKNAYDMLRRKLKDKELLHYVITSTREGYRLTQHVIVKGHSSMGLRSTRE